MTEAEAMTKWCPFVRAAADQDDHNACNAGILSYERNPEIARCIGSDCMAWRWGEGLYMKGRMPVDPKDASSENEPASRPADVPESWKWSASDAAEGEACWIEPEHEAQARRAGYCGLAGRPEFP